MEAGEQQGDKGKKSTNDALQEKMASRKKSKAQNTQKREKARE